ncbi:MAG: hypothetical protein ACXWC0_06910, partial [Burkholderiales bacterium]
MSDDKRFDFSDADRAPLAGKAKVVRRKFLLELGSVVSPDTGHARSFGPKPARRKPPADAVSALASDRKPDVGRDRA